MFDRSAFASWPLVLIGALAFGLLFGFIGTLSDFLFNRVWGITRFSALFALCAFVGYLGVVSLIRCKGGS
jgi:hypothetical protein